MNSNELKVGDIVRLHNQIDPAFSIVGVIKHIELDDGECYVYIFADELELNDKYDATVGAYYELCPINWPYLFKIADATSN